MFEAKTGVKGAFSVGEAASRLPQVGLRQPALQHYKPGSFSRGEGEHLRSGGLKLDEKACLKQSWLLVSDL